MSPNLAQFPPETPRGVPGRHQIGKHCIRAHFAGNDDVNSSGQIELHVGVSAVFYADNTACLVEQE